jgi:hypothetical protein
VRKTKTVNHFLHLLLLCTLAGCAGVERSCSSCAASSLGADWVVVELREYDGTPYRCWMLTSVSIENETNSDGIYWVTADGNLIHVSGSYDRVQVEKGQWDAAFAEINMTEKACKEINQSVYDPGARDYIFPTRRSP